ncbi:MAG: energy transducer TonB [Pseudomonadota bacterium]
MDEHGERRREQKARDRSGLLLALAVSLLAHLALLPPLLHLFRQGDDSFTRREAVRLVSIRRSDWQRHRSLKSEAMPSPAAEPRQDPPPKKDQHDDPEAPGQVVALPPPEKSERPDQARYASEYDRRVERETRSRYQTPDFLNPTHRPQVGDPQKRDTPSASEPNKAPMIVQAEQAGGPEGPGRQPDGRGQAPDQNGGGRAAAELSLPRLEQRDALALRTDPSTGSMRNRSYSEALNGLDQRLALRLGPLQQRGQGERLAPGPEGQQGGSGQQGPGVAALMPDLRTLERLSGAPANDHLRDVEDDEATFLSTWQWKHAPFFNRVADGIRREWRPGPEIARRDPTGNIYGFQDRYTQLRVTINRTGAIQGIVVSESCGVDFLDREAVGAFQRAQPFSNPPSRLFASGETYTFQFGFNVDFQTSPMVQFNWRAAP